MMKELDFYLDGKENGLVALNENDEIMTIGRYHQTLFKSIELMKATIEREKITSYNTAIILNYKKKDQLILTSEKLIKPSPDYYEYIDLKNNEIYTICLDVSKETTICSGYFTFTENPNERITNYEEGKIISEKCYSALLESIALEQKKGNVAKSEVDHVHSIATFLTKRRIYDSTLTLRIMRGFELVRINKYRKDIEFKVFPFDNNVDKYKNIYFVFSKNNDENINDKIYFGSMYKILNNIKETLQTQYPDLLANYKITNTRHIEL